MPINGNPSDGTSRFQACRLNHTARRNGICVNTIIYTSAGRCNHVLPSPYPTLGTTRFFMSGSVGAWTAWLTVVFPATTADISSLIDCPTDSNCGIPTY